MGKAFFSESYGILLNCHENFYEFKKVFDYCERYQDRSLPLGERLLAYAFIECIVFFPFFAWITRHQYMGHIPTTVKGNNWVRVEEGMYVSGHSYVYKIIKGVSKLRAEEICSELVDCVKNMWETRILSDGKNEVNGFTLVKVQKYIDHLQETMLNATRFCDYVKTKNLFTHMEYLKAYTRVNFFERHVTEYSTIHDIEYNDRFFDNCNELKFDK